MRLFCMVIIGLVLTFGLSAGASTNVEKGASVCVANELNEEAITVLEEWIPLMDKGIENLTQGEALMGMFLSQVCGTFRDSYEVVVLKEQGDYLLVVLLPEYGFGDDPGIMQKSRTRQTP